MKVSRKHLLLFSILSVVVLSVTIPLYMYFSHNGQELQSGWPHRMSNAEDAKIVILPKKPRNWTPLAGVSRYGQSAIVLSEDWAFYQHDGFDSEQMRVAFEEAANGGRVRGASTITQQMVKNVWLTEERSIWRKLHEFILAYKIDKELNKKKILEVYLNVIEFGPGIYGIGDASRHYFRKHPSLLTPRESAFLAMLLPSPKRYYVSFKKKQLSPFARERIQQILVKMRQGKAITPEQYLEEMNSRFFWEMP